MVDFKSIGYMLGIFLALIILVIVIRFLGLFMTLLIVIVVSVLSLVIILAFTTGFKKSGRLMGGLFAIIGKPGSGKTYTATAIALDRMKEGRLVFSNYPITSVDGVYCSRVIEGITSTGQVIEKIHWLMAQNLNRAVLVIDEAHLFWWSRDFKEFKKEDKNFFTFLAQHEIEVYYIVQHENRMDTIANDCATLFGIVTKMVIPFIDMPIRFSIVWWSAEEEIRTSILNPAIVPFDIENFWFNKDVASAYDTRFFGHDLRPRYQGITWKEFHRKYNNKYWTEPRDVSLVTKIRRIMSKPILNQIRPIFVYIYWWFWCRYVFFWSKGVLRW